MFAAYILSAIPQIAFHTSPLPVPFAMIFRRSSTNVTSGPAPPQPISGPSCGGPSSVATNQRPFLAGAAETLETEFPRPGTSSRAIPPLPPPRPTPPPICLVALVDSDGNRPGRILMILTPPPLKNMLQRNPTVCSGRWRWRIYGSRSVQS